MFRSLNRIGNLLVPNSNYCAFEDWVIPILDTMVEEQEGEEKVKWSPSSVIRRLGKEINNEDSVYYWCYKVSIGRQASHEREAKFALPAEQHSRLLSSID
jgi:deoxyhypusine synthase